MKSPENRIAGTFYMLLTTLALLTLFGYLMPQSFFSAYNIRKVDYLAPLVQKTEKPSLPEKPAKVKSKNPRKTAPAPVPQGLVTLEDYSENNVQLRYFLSALQQLKTSSGECRIAFYGDSFIEGDIFTMDLRDSLQKHFGGKGVGYLPISTETSMFRKSMPSESEGWKVHSIGNNSPKEELGISGTVYIPGEEAEIKLYPPTSPADIQLIYNNTGADIIIESISNRKYVVADTLRSSAGLAMHTLHEGKDSIRNYALKMQGNRDIKIYGLNIGSGKGIYLDNFSMRGSSGLGLREIPDSQLVAFKKLMNYKLIVLQFGLNVAMAKTTDFSNYEKNMTKMIMHMKELLPETSFLLLSTSDRSYRQNGSYVTMPSIPLMVEAQRRIAQESGILFWDMYKAMGGENSMVAFVKDKKANKDYTHLNFAGGKVVADHLFKAIMYEYRNYKTIAEDDTLHLAVR